MKNLQAMLDKRKSVEAELELMVKDLREKLDKYEVDKKLSLKQEKAKRESDKGKQEQEKRDLEDKLLKMKSQFDKAAVESKKEISRYDMYRVLH